MFKENDIVLLEYRFLFKFPPKVEYDNTDYLKVRLISLPADTGDFFVFQELETGIIFKQNPMDSNFVRMFKLEDNNAIEER